MTERVLKLSEPQLYEIYNATWREFVALHKQATANPYGLHKAVIERVRLSRTATAQVCEMIEAMQPDFATTNESYLMARKQIKTEAEHGVIFATTRNGASFVMADFKSTARPCELSEVAPFAFPIPLGFDVRPSNEVLEVAELAIGLHGREFAMLTVDELKRFRLLREFGRKFGVIVSVEVINDSEDIQAEIAAASPARQEEIYGRLRTEIAVRWIPIDNGSAIQ